MFVYVSQVLWPDGIFFLKVGNAQSNDDTDSDLKSFQAAKQLSASKVSKPASFEQQLEAARRASDVKKMLLGECITDIPDLFPFLFDSLLCIYDLHSASKHNVAEFFFCFVNLFEPSVFLFPSHQTELPQHW